MIVVGTRNSKSNAAPSFWYLRKIKKNDPIVMQTIDAANKNIATPLGIPLSAIAWTTKGKFFILVGSETAKTKDRQNRPKKSNPLLICKLDDCIVIS